MFFFKQKTAYEITTRLVGSEMCIRDRVIFVVEVDSGLAVLHDIHRAELPLPIETVSYTHLTLPTIA